MRRWRSAASAEDKRTVLPQLLRIYEIKKEREWMLGLLGTEPWVTNELSGAILDGTKASLLSNDWREVYEFCDLLILHRAAAKPYILACCDRALSAKVSSIRSSALHAAVRLAPDSPTVSLCVGRALETSDEDELGSAVGAVYGLSKELQKEHLNRAIELICFPEGTGTRYSKDVTGSCTALLRQHDLTDQQLVGLLTRVEETIDVMDRKRGLVSAVLYVLAPQKTLSEQVVLQANRLYANCPNDPFLEDVMKKINVRP